MKEFINPFTRGRIKTIDMVNTLSQLNKKGYLEESHEICAKGKFLSNVIIHHFQN